MYKLASITGCPMRNLLFKIKLTFLILTTSLNFSHAADKYNLVYVEQEGCIYCEIWDEEISSIYPKTTEGSIAPLIRVDIADYEQNLISVNPVVFTPTFILTKNSKEISRIEGYIGDDLFWGMLEVMLKRETNFELD
jgi:thioredoxin-related protein